MRRYGVSGGNADWWRIEMCKSEQPLQPGMQLEQMITPLERTVSTGSCSQ